jgi:hypothetical protein
MQFSFARLNRSIPLDFSADMGLEVFFAVLMDVLCAENGCMRM